MSLPVNPGPERTSVRPTVMRPVLKKDWVPPAETAPVVETPGPQEVYRPIIKQKDPAEQPLIRTDSVIEERPEPEPTDKIVRNAPPWMISGIVHILLLLALALWLLPVVLRREVGVELEAEVEVNVDLEEEIWAETLGVQLEMPTESMSMIHETTETDMADEHNPVDDPWLALPELPYSDSGDSQYAESSDAPTGQIALNGRTPGGRAGLIGRYGGNELTENAVDMALEWLKRNQLRDGSWSLKGNYADGVHNENRESATAMALLAFQGAGHTHKEGKHKTVVANGWNWLLKRQGKDGCFFDEEGIWTHQFYTHGQCTIALCELYAMSKDEKLKVPAQRAVKYLIDAQSPQGGWRYRPFPIAEESDVSVTGWCVMALQSARMADLEVPQETLDKISAYLDKVGTREGTRYAYQSGESSSRVMTAEAMLCRQYLGWSQDDERMEDALDFVLQSPINYEKDRNVYYWYYATQAMHHKEGRWWDEWNKVMRDVVPRHQVKSGPEAGSWHPLSPTPDRWGGSDGGRLYVTCLSVYMLEVYYRHLPIYAKMFDADGMPMPVHHSSEDAAADAPPVKETPKEAEEKAEDDSADDIIL